MTLIDILPRPAVTMERMYAVTSSDGQLARDIFEIDMEIRDLYRDGESIPTIICERRSMLIEILKTRHHRGAN